MEIPEAPALQTVEDSSRKKQIANRHIKTRRSGRVAIDGWIWGILFRNRRWVWFWGTVFHNRAWGWFWWANIEAQGRVWPTCYARLPALVTLLINHHFAAHESTEILLENAYELDKGCVPKITNATQFCRRSEGQLVNIRDSGELQTIERSNGNTKNPNRHH